MMDSEELTSPKEETLETPVAETAETVTEESAPAVEQPEAETPAPEEPEAPAEEAESPAEEETKAEEEEEKHTIPLFTSKEQVLARAQEIAASEEAGDKQELDLLKQLYYKFHKVDGLAARQAYIDAGNDPDTFVPEIDPTEEQFKVAMQTIRERRANLAAAQEKERGENLQKKREVIDKIKELASTPEEANKSYDTFKKLQTEWREIGPVPAENVTETWKNYQLAVEQFYDMLKINIEMREYDFKKNLEAKTLLCEQAEALANETDIIAAFNQLQTLHQEYKEIGPVAKDLREEIWNRFKAASTVINKRHQEFFESRHAEEESNLAKKTELCEKIEAITTEGLKTFAEWEAKTKEIIDVQAIWKTIGYAPQKMNTQIFERFRAACDKFFTAKAEYFKAVKEELNQNLAKKRSLVEQAEALKDSTEWRKTSDALIELQKQWKTIGSVPKKYSEDLWKRFVGACDAFFEAKNKATAGQRNEEQANLAKKQDIIAQLKELAENTVEDAAQKVRDLQAEWNETGHVPFRDKDKIYKEYREVVDKLYKDLNLSQARRRLNNFKSSVKERAAQGGSALSRERDRMLRAYEVMKSEIQTYENNIGFLSANSKKGNSLVAEIQKKVEKLKDELNLLAQKIKAIEEEMRNQE